MGRQRGNNFIVGTFDNVTYYEFRGGYYLRKKSALNQQRFQQDPAFAHSRARAAQFSEAVQLAKEIYTLLPKAVRQRGFIGILTGQVHRKLLHGLSKQEIVTEIIAANAEKKI